MELLELFILFLCTSVVYSAQETTSNTSVPLVESTTSVPVSSTQAHVVASSSVPSTADSSTSMTVADHSRNAIEFQEPTELMLVLNNSNKACVLLKMEVSLTLEYMNTSNVTVSSMYPLTEAEVNKNRSSSCRDSETAQMEDLYASFNMSNSLHFLFNRTSSDKFAVSLLEFNSTDIATLFPDAMAKQSMSLHSEESIFETSNNMSYKCDSETRVNLRNAAGNSTNSFITFKMVQVEAFRTTLDDNFANAMDCSADEISNIIPIAVGCALAGLVVIVLIAYLVGRRQKRQRGYESV